MGRKVRLNGFPNRYGAFKVRPHGRCQVVHGHLVTLHAVVDAVVEDKHVDASLHPRMTGQKAHFAQVSTVNLDGKGVISTLAYGIDDHLGGF
tara:strand:- start:342 stop:617 length:276 start_codon:yes stop_codon:yes gene_type:complete